MTVLLPFPIRHWRQEGEVSSNPCQRGGRLTHGKGHIQITPSVKTLTTEQLKKLDWQSISRSGFLPPATLPSAHRSRQAENANRTFDYPFVEAFVSYRRKRGGLPLNRNDGLEHDEWPGSLSLSGG